MQKIKGVVLTFAALLALWAVAILLGPKDPAGEKAQERADMLASMPPSTVPASPQNPNAVVDTKKTTRDDEMTEIKMQRLVRGFVTANLKDPDSAQFRNQRGGCGEVNAKNSFGGKAGYRRFIAASKDLVFIEGESGLSAADFQDVWEKVCSQ